MVRLRELARENDGAIFASIVLSSQAAKDKVFLKRMLEFIAGGSISGLLDRHWETSQRALLANATGKLENREAPLSFLVHPLLMVKFEEFFLLSGAADEASPQTFLILLSQLKEASAALKTQEVIGMYSTFADDTNVVTTRVTFAFKDGYFHTLLMDSNPEGHDHVLFMPYTRALGLAFGNDRYRPKK